MNVSAPKAISVQSTQRLNQIQNTEKKDEMQAKQRETEVKKSAPYQAAPMVNTQGQITGRLLNVTA